MNLEGNMSNFIKVKNKTYIYQEIKIGWFRFSFSHFGKKFSIRFEISKGWDK
jgi:hypothetical protein